MNHKYITGKISFIHHEKNRAVIEYEENGKKKTIQGDISEKAQLKLIEQKLIKKTHRFLVGDQVVFLLQKTGAGGKMTFAGNIRYQYNTVLETLIHKATTENRFLGYIKITDGTYFIKEIETYLFFPLKIAAYEIPPTEKEIEKPVAFKLEHTDKPGKITAVLYNHHYIPAFLTAVQYFKKKTVVQSTISKITRYGIYVNLVNEEINAKLTIDSLLAKQIEEGKLKPGDTIPVLIKHLSADRIVAETVTTANDQL